MGTYNSTYNSADNYRFDNSVIDAKQEELRKKKRRIYTTYMIDELIKEANNGYDIPYEPFFQKDLELRAANVTFEMTKEERDIFQRCYDDANYYAANYCQFMTDNGRRTVELRDFQQKIIQTVTDERFIEKNDDYGPKNRNVIWMASRQSGKCNLLEINELDKNILSNTLSKNEDSSLSALTKNNPNKIFIGNKYYNIRGFKKIIEKLEYILVKIYRKI